MIDASKKYRTRDGRAVRVLATDLKGGNRSLVVAIAEYDGDETVITLPPDGLEWPDRATSYDLIEVGPYDDFVIDEPVLALVSGGSPEWQKRYFAGVSESGLPLVFINGRTRWSSNEHRIDCDEVRRPTEEELK